MNKEYKKEIEGMIANLTTYCRAHGVPMGVVFAENSGNDTKYECDVVTPLQCNVELKRDLISPMLVMFNEGFSVIPKTAVDYDFAAEAVSPTEK